MRTAFLDHPRPVAFAHRGGAAHAPENSWRAFEHALGLGYWYLETDLQATADGVLVAFHDRTLDRVTDRAGRIARLPYREVAKARIAGTEPIPRLDDLLAAWPDVRFNVDLKDGPVIGPLAGVLRRTASWDRVCVTSFSASRLRAARRVLDRPVCMAASPFGISVVRFGGPRRPRDQRRPAQPPPISPSPLRRRGAQLMLAERMARTGVRCAQVPATVATPAFVARAHALGLDVHAWTVNSPATMRRLLDTGVDGIMTDETVALRDVLISRGDWHPRVSQPGNQHRVGWNRAQRES
ncbi:MAG TPA: glycerophosphodiester phosphodiesterase family protein [Streptosporangiaceae bacterium]|nr:glycerophosphodiester phosphodiesterase family protein [Streptosporangiaceae bacterium]